MDKTTMMGPAKEDTEHASDGNPVKEQNAQVCRVFAVLAHPAFLNTFATLSSKKWRRTKRRP